MNSTPPCARVTKPSFGSGTAGLGKLATATLIDRIVDAAKQRIDRLARIPTQRRSARLHEWRVFGKGRVGPRLRHLQHQARDRRLSDARRSVENRVLRIGGLIWRATRAPQPPGRRRRAAIAAEAARARTRRACAAKRLSSSSLACDDGVSGPPLSRSASSLRSLTYS